MLRSIAQAVLLLGLIGAASLSFAGEKIQELDTDRGDARTYSFGAQDRLLCVDGLKVFQTVSYGSGAGVSNIQLYEVRNGKVVPATCTKTKSPSKK